MNVSRAAVLAYRAAAHDLEHPTAAKDCGVLDAGVQDTPPGTTAQLALDARLSGPARGLALVHSMRGAMHLHRAKDLPLLAAALRPDRAEDLLVQTHGRFFADLGDDVAIGDAWDEVAGAMATVMADGEPRTKGELSTALNRTVAKRLRPWCSGCGVDHVHDGLFRMATLPAGLRLEPQPDRSARFVAGAQPKATDATRARRELARRFLRLAGAASPASLGAWLGFEAKAAARWWDLIADETVEVSVDGRRLYTLGDLPGRATPTRAHLLPAYDPWLEIADRDVVAPAKEVRRQVWRPANNPGVLLVGGEIAGIWRRKNATVTVTALLPVAASAAITPSPGTSIAMA
jgi:hypothetical protein